MKKSLQKKQLFFLLPLLLLSVNMMAQNITLLPMGSTWHYLDNGSDQGSTWTATSFDHSSWASGAGQLGFGDGDEATVISYGPDANNKYTTTYFRTSFSIADINAFDYIKLVLNRDDGAIVYVNGTEIKRANMPAGIVTYQTFASSNSEIVETFIIPKTGFVTGINVMAVEVHQTDLTSSDLSMDLSLEGIAANEVFVIGQGASWKYLDNGTDQGTTWVSTSYDDATWATGIAPLGYSMTGVVSTVSFGPSSTNKYRTTYFRKNVIATDLNSFDSLRVTLRIDDGAIVYINGAEVLRRNMPAGAINNTTFANTTVASAPAVFTVNVPKTAMLLGNNTFAVEVHQSTANSSDLFFDLGIEPYVKDSVVVSTTGSWKYNDQGIAPASGWNNTGFDDASWDSGNAVLGYGNGDEATTVSYGNDVQNKHITTYFRKTFTLESIGSYRNVELKLLRDDGAIVYLNGTEVYRSNINSGSVTALTQATTPVEGTQENAWFTINVPATLLVEGENVIAVEVHKFNKIESDLRFNLQASLQFDAKTQTIVSPTVTCDPLSSDKIGCFTSVKPSAQTQGLVIPETHTFQLIAQQGNVGIYSNSTRNMPSTHDFTGYVPTNGSSKLGIVAVNHENTPGDVSLLSVHLNESTMTWVRDSARLVDFAPLVRTVRNCSGGVTPWGTVITSEETTSTGDANADGYQDVGWQVEIDPVSGKIMDYNNDGNPDKIWAMGRMNHENIAVSADSSVAYQAEDGGTSCVYKYVLTVKGKMNNGTLYVLKRDNPTATTGTWEVVPNGTQAEVNSTGNLAQAVGGTNWNGPEDVEFGPDGKMYFTSKGTGTIWRFKDDGMTVSGIEAWVTNTSYPITHSEGTINENFSTGIDNLTFDGEGNLWAMQDGSRNHLWVIRPDHTPAAPHVELFAVTPSGAESTGLTFTPDFRYGFISIQHPTGTNATILQDAAGNNVRFNMAATIVFARKEFLGANAVLPSFDLGSNLSDCEEVSITANPASMDVLNIWADNGSTSNQRTVNTTGWYKATAYANNGKTYTDSIYVTIHGNPTLELGSNINACDGVDTPVLLDAGIDAGYSYLWNDNSTNHDLQVLIAGEYRVTKTNTTTYCVSEDSVEVFVHAPPAVALGNDTLICHNCSVTLDAGSGYSSYLWSNGATTQTITVNTAGDYDVVVTDNNGCDDNDEISVAKSSAPTSIHDAVMKQNGFMILQNGQSGGVTIVAELQSSSDLNLSLLDMTGSIVATLANASYSAGTHTWEIDPVYYKHLSKGIYIARMQAGQKLETRKFNLY